MTTWTQPGFEAVACLVNQRTGLSLAKRHDSAEHGMKRAMARAKIVDLAQYAERLAGDDATLDDLIGELTVGETYFFREPAHFHFIQQQILPDLRARRGSGHTLRAWSAACATGEEAYSLAILFAQCGLEQAHLAATDITRAALAKARLAIFSAWSLRGESPLAARAYLTQVGKEYRLDEKIRQRVNFAHLNLALDAYPSFAAGIWGMDLILCRNVLIYFDGDTVRRTAQRLHATLADGGWLITASSDPPLWEHAPFEVVADANGLFYRRAGGAPASRGGTLPTDLGAAMMCPNRQRLRGPRRRARRLTGSVGTRRSISAIDRFWRMPAARAGTCGSWRVGTRRQPRRVRGRCSDIRCRRSCISCTPRCSWMATAPRMRCGRYGASSISTEAWQRRISCSARCCAGAAIWPAPAGLIATRATCVRPGRPKRPSRWQTAKPPVGLPRSPARSWRFWKSKSGSLVR